jgi:hypothetical protein
LLNGISETVQTAIINNPIIKISLVLILYIFEQHFLFVLDCIIIQLGSLVPLPS